MEEPGLQDRGRSSMRPYGHQGDKNAHQQPLLLNSGAKEKLDPGLYNSSGKRTSALTNKAYHVRKTPRNFFKVGKVISQLSYLFPANLKLGDQNIMA
jgi:hypothetical protein